MNCVELVGDFSYPFVRSNGSNGHWHPYALWGFVVIFTYFHMCWHVCAGSSRPAHCLSLDAHGLSQRRGRQGRAVMAVMGVMGETTSFHTMKESHRIPVASAANHLITIY